MKRLFSRLLIVTLFLCLVILGISGWAIFVGKVSHPLAALSFPPAGDQAVSLPLDGPGFPFMLRRGLSMQPGVQPVRVLLDGKPLAWRETPNDVLKGGQDAYSFDRKSIAVARLASQTGSAGGGYSVEFDVEVHPALYLFLCILVAALLFLTRGEAAIQGDWRRLGWFVKSLLIQIGPWAGMTVLLLALGWAGWRSLPLAEKKRTLADNSISIIVREQIERAQSLGDLDMLLAGDSSCLMGVDAPLLGRLLNGRVESLCAVGYLGPRGYATLIERYLATHSTTPSVTILMHPVQMLRSPDWEGWADLVANDPLPPREKVWREALQFYETQIFDRVVYVPLSGSWGEYFGSRALLSRMVQNSGGAVDPAGIVGRQKGIFQADAGPVSFERNEGFNLALERLAETIRRVGPQRVFLIITPAPKTLVFGSALAEFDAARKDIAARLGIPASNILDLPPAMADDVFATATHLNLDGRDRYTRAMAAQYRGRGLSAPWSER